MNVTVVYTSIARLNMLAFCRANTELLERKITEPAEDPPHPPGFPTPQTAASLECCVAPRVGLLTFTNY